MLTVPTRDQLYAAGFDDDAVASITRVLVAFASHLQVWAADDSDLRRIFAQDDEASRQSLASYIEHIVRVEGSAEWVKRLIGLAHALDMSTGILDSQFVLCWSRGHFDIWLKKRLLRPKAEAIRAEFDVILTTYSTIEDRAAALQKAKLCRDRQMALAAANAVKGTMLQRRAILRICAIFRAWACFSYAGLLHLSGHPFAEELRLFEAYLQDLSPEDRPSFAVVSATRRTLLALCRGVTQVHPPLWQRHLLFEPPSSPARIEYEHHLLSFVRLRIASQVAELLEIPSSQAEELYLCFIRQGLPGLFDHYLSREAGSLHHSVELRRFLTMVREQSNTVVDLSWQREIMRLANALITVLQESKIPLSHLTLIKDRPSSRRRISWGRRLSFGVPSIVRQRQARGQRKDQPRQRRFRWEPTLISQFAQLGLLGEDDATNRLRNIVSRGVIGFIPQGNWSELFDGRLIAWLKLMKFGRPPFAVSWSQIYRFVTQYAEMLGIPAPAPQLLEAFYRSLGVPSYWFGGKGLSMIRVHQKGKQTITDRPRLHARWLVIVVELKLPVLDEVRQITAAKSFLVLIVDEETELPMGGRLCAGVPDSLDVLLALYQAIWHPGTEAWPLHGTPGVIRVAAPLISPRQHEFDQAARYLQAEMEIPEKVSLSGKLRLQRMVHDLRIQGVAYVKEHTKQEPIRLEQGIGWLLDYLREAYLPHHRGESDSRFRSTGVGMAGHDTPAAGWLLPYGDNGAPTTVSERGVLIDGQWYSSPYLQPLVGSICRYRRYPAYYPGRDVGVFIEVVKGDGQAMLHYLTRRG